MAPTPSTTYRIDEYAVRLWSSRPTTEHDPQTAVTGIYFYESGVYRGYAYFYPDGTALADPVIDADQCRIFLSYNLSQLSDVLSTLRAEKPLFVYAFGTANAGIMTGREPTGEQEELLRETP